MRSSSPNSARLITSTLTQTSHETSLPQAFKDIINHFIDKKLYAEKTFDAETLTQLQAHLDNQQILDTLFIKIKEEYFSNSNNRPSAVTWEKACESLDNQKLLYWFIACRQRADELQELINTGQVKNSSLDILRHKETPLSLACKLGMAQHVDIILKHFKIDTWFRQTLPMHAVSHVDTLQVLVNNKIGLNLEVRSETALTLAVKKEQAKSVKFLLENGADPGYLIRISLSHAIKLNNPELVQLLLEKISRPLRNVEDLVLTVYRKVADLENAMIDDENKISLQKSSRILFLLESANIIFPHEEKLKLINFAFDNNKKNIISRWAADIDIIDYFYHVDTALLQQQYASALCRLEIILSSSNKDKRASEPFKNKCSITTHAFLQNFKPKENFYPNKDDIHSISRLVELLNIDATDALKKDVSNKECIIGLMKLTTLIPGFYCNNLKNTLEQFQNDNIKMEVNKLTSTQQAQLECASALISIVDSLNNGPSTNQFQPATISSDKLKNDLQKIKQRIPEYFENWMKNFRFNHIKNPTSRDIFEQAYVAITDDRNIYDYYETAKVRLNKSKNI